MKKKNLLRALNDVDEALLEKADPTKQRGVKPRRGVFRIALVATLSVLMVAGCLWMFIPFKSTPPDVSKYADNKYFDIIQKLNVATYVKPRFKNNFEKYVLNNIRDVAKDEGYDNANDAIFRGEGGAYEEVTDNQVAGVIEGDRLKRTDLFAYYLNYNCLEVYSIRDPKDTKKVDSYDLYNLKNRYENYSFNYLEEWELYLSEDGGTLTVILAAYDKNSGRSWKYDTVVASFEAATIQEPKIKLKDTVCVSGAPVSSRIVDGELLLITGFRVWSGIDFSDEAQFLPQVDTGDGFVSILPEKITSPDVLSSAFYTVTCKLDEKELSLMDSAAFLSYSDEVYATSEDLFVTRAYSDKVEIDGTVYSRSMTEIRRICYSGEHFEQKGAMTVEGSVLNQYSMDVYDGIFRVVTTTQEVPQGKKGEILDVDTSNTTNAALYCFDLATGVLRASVMDFAPQGETVESVRFDGDTAYVCTAVVVKVTDPVFFFDLSDLDDITYKETGEIEGYSTSLINFGEGYLLGIGVGDTGSSLKVEVFAESEDRVVSVCAYEPKNTSYSDEYKSYFIDRERGLIGFAVRVSENKVTECRYVLLSFDGNELHELLNEEYEVNDDTKYFLHSMELDSARAFLKDGYFYIFGDGLTVKKLW